MANTATDRLARLYSEVSNRAGSGGIPDVRSTANLISFWAGLPDPDSLPIDDVIEATRIAMEQDGDWFLQYGASAGDPALVEELIKKLDRDQGIKAGPENILVTNGASQAISVIVDMLVNPGDVVISEAPTWTGAVDNFTKAGANIREIPVGDQGINVDILERELRSLKATGQRAKFIYVIPTFQNPTGVTMPLERRKRLVELAAEYNVPIIEDDAYIDLRYSGERVPTLYSLDGSGRVIFVGTFSKIMAAGMRLGWVVAHPAVIARMSALKPGGASTPVAQGVAAQFAASGTLIEHINELRGIYAARRDAMLAALEEAMPAAVSWTEPDGGFFVWLTFPDGFDAQKFNEEALEAGVQVSPGPGFYYHDGGANEIRLSYSFANVDQIRSGIAVLGELAAKQLP